MQIERYFLPEEPNSPDLLLTGAGSITIGTIAQNLQVNMPENWRSDGSLWDIWSHVGNVPATFICTSVTILTVAHIRDQLLSKVPISEAIYTTAIGFVMGVCRKCCSRDPEHCEYASRKRCLFGSTSRFQ